MSPPKKRALNTRHPDASVPANRAPEIVDPIWLAKALALTLSVALLCAWLTACLLFYQGEWQLVLHTSPTVDRTPASVGLSFMPVRFGDFGTGAPHLTGWWIPAESSSQSLAPDAKQLPSAPPSSALTILYLHNGSGSLADTLPAITLLHSTGLSVFAIDYRGFGSSDASIHPDADRMADDASAALDYLIATRHVPATSIIPMGNGLGAALAVQLAHNHSDLPAVILDNPDPDPAATAAAANPSRIIPIRQLFGSRFAIAAPLATLTTPKLLIAAGPSAAPHTSAASLDNLFHHAAAPKDIVTLPPSPSNAVLQQALHRFLSQYVQPTPNPVP